MAHSCPTCDSYCTCRGDIDDMQLDETEFAHNCIHCDDSDDGDIDLNDESLLGEKRVKTCGKCGLQETVYSQQDTALDLCYDCCGELGYCYGCGTFAAGTNSFEFSDIGFYCENCQDEIRTTCDPDGDELEDWEYPDFEGFSTDQPE
jgi:hypothetical protein